MFTIWRSECHQIPEGVIFTTGSLQTMVTHRANRANKMVALDALI